MNTIPAFLRRAALLLGLLTVAAVPLACDSGGSNDAKTCSLSAGPNSKDFPVTVDYTATITGESEITELTYNTDNGEQSVSSLTSSWSKSVDVSAGTSVEITADAKLQSGSVEVAYEGRDADGNLVLEESDACDVNSN